jgi:hypothetical protein
LTQQFSQGSPLKSSTKIQKKGRPVYNPGLLIIAGALFLLFCLVLLAFFTKVECTDRPGAGSCLQILFIGNSYTSTNDLPGMITRLAKAGGYKVKTEMVAPGGWTFSEHAKSTKTLDTLKSVKWDFVVLQEQSQIPASKQSRMVSMYPSARLLVSQIRESQAEPIFFQTWAHRDGWPEMGLPDYQSMQLQIDYGYQQIAQELKVPIAPAGYGWLLARKQYPQLALWQGDGSHPNEQGTYLAACVLYAAIFHQSPEGLTYMAHMSEESAHTLQTIAASVVLNP